MVMWLFFISFLVLIVLRFPIAYALGVSSVIYFVGEGVSLKVIPQIMTSTFDSFVLLAVPLFMLAGELMNSGGITDRLFNFANKLVGHVKGGLAHVNVVASMIFAGMTGSAVSDAAGLGVIEIKAMLDEGFDPDFSAAVTAASSTIGPVIPPSIPFVLYGSMAGVSVGGLFLGGAIPGVIMGLALMIFCYLISIKRNYPCHKRTVIKELARSFLTALPPLMTPIIIIGGILGGIFTPTEAAVVAVVYALVLGIFIYKELNFEKIGEILLKVAKNTASIMIIVSLATVFGWVLSYQGFTQTISQGLLGITHNKFLILLLINLILLIVGCFMETIAALLIVVPMFVPVCQAVGIDLLQFGVITTLNLMIGLITPPVGVNLYVVSRVANVAFERTVKAIWPFVIVLFGVLMLISYVPSLVTYLPSLLR
jgi:tripartite ATP-independent transporter DctM subunit